MKEKDYAAQSGRFLKNFFSRKEIKLEISTDESQEFLIERDENISKSNEESTISNESSQLNENNTKNKFLNKLKTFDGYTYALLFTLFRSLSNIFIKMSPSLIGSEHSSIRYFIQLTVTSLIIIYNKIDLTSFKDQAKWLFARSFVGSTSVVLGLFAIFYINPSDSSTLNNLSLIVTALIARLLLNEKLTTIHIFSAVLSFIGIVFILRPEFLFKYSHKNFSNKNSTFESTLTETVVKDASLDKVYLSIGVVFAISSAILLGISHVITKKLHEIKVHYAAILFFPSCVGLPIGLVISLILFSLNISHRNSDLISSSKLQIHILFSVVSGFLGTMAAIFLNWALDKEDATKVSIIKTTDVFLTYLLQYLTLNIHIDLLGALGALFILIGTFSLIIIKPIENKFASSSSVLKFIFKKF